MRPDIAGQTGDLLELVFGGDGHENWLVKAATEQFHLPALHQCSKAVKIFGAMLLDPGEQGTGIMKAEMNAGMFFEMLEKREVGIVMRFFENVFEIATGLVGMNEKSKMESLRPGHSFFLATMIASQSNF